ncbi:MAG: hypothetical protein RIC55_15910 [Pirellulaceae bacterium]
MRKVQFESDVIRALIRDRQHLEVCDEQGQTVGYFVPADLYLEMTPRPATNEEHVRALSEVSIEENERRLRKAGIRAKDGELLGQPERLA